MKTTPNQLHIEAARILKKSNWTYEYNYPEKVSESYMHDVISLLELNIDSISEEILAKAISTEITKWGADQEDEFLKTPKAIAEFSADGVAYSLMSPLPYKTVTFKIC